MTVYEAIMKAADSIEQNPHLFHFNAVSAPTCVSPGCALGWIGFHLGMKDLDGPYTLDVGKALGFAYYTHISHPFYERMKDLTGGMAWRDDTALCAKGLRLYAAKYHKPVSREIPGCVLNIFNEVIAQPITVKPVDVPQL
jgi:hypothetical protein